MSELQRFVRRCLPGILEMFLFAPVLLLADALLVPWHDRRLWLLSILLLYMLSAAAYHLFGLRRYAFYFLLAAAYGAVWVTLLPLAGWDLSGTALFLLYLAAGFRGAACAALEGGVYPEHHYWVSLPLYFFGYFFFRFIPLLQPFQTAFYWAGLIAVILGFYAINHAQLKSAAYAKSDQDDVPKGMLRSNRMYTTALLLLIFLAAASKEIWTGLHWAVKQLFLLLLALLSRLSSTGVPEPAPSRPQQPQMLPPAETSPFWLLLEKWLKYGAALLIGAAVAAGLAFVLYKLVRRLIFLVQLLLEQLHERSRGRGEEYGGYRDEKESLLSAGNWGEGALGGLRQWLQGLLSREPSWKDLDSPREKARYLYRHWLLRGMQRGFDYEASRTPREHEQHWLRWGRAPRFPAGEVVRLYEEARYSGREPDAGPLEELHDALQQLKK
jgi:hypothetical protein